MLAALAVLMQLACLAAVATSQSPPHQAKANSTRPLSNDCTLRGERQCDLDTASFLARHYPKHQQLARFIERTQSCISSGPVQLLWGSAKREARDDTDGPATVLRADLMGANLQLAANYANRSVITSNNISLPVGTHAADVCSTGCGLGMLRFQHSYGSLSIVADSGLNTFMSPRETGMSGDVCSTARGWSQSFGRLAGVLGTSVPTDSSGKSVLTVPNAAVCVFEFSGCLPQSYAQKDFAQLLAGGDVAGRLLETLEFWSGDALSAVQRPMVRGASVLISNVTAQVLKGAVVSQMLLQSQALSTVATSSFVFAKALVDTKLLVAKDVELAVLLRRTATASELCSSLTTDPSTCRNTTDALAAAADRAINETCVPTDLDEFSDCCSVPSLQYRARGLVGRLPDSFIAAPLTDFRDNPQLCGLVTRQSGANSTYLLRNSNVRLSLADLPAYDADVVVRQVHGPLGNDLMSYNLQGPVREGDAVRVCALLEAGGVTIGTFNKGCRPVMHAATMMQKECLNATDYFLGVFASALRIDEYNRFIKASDPGLACGEDGRKQRVKVAGVIWGVTMGCTAALYLVYIGMWVQRYKEDIGAARPREKCCQCVRNCFAGKGNTLFFFFEITMLLVDEVSDWIFVSQVAEYGNVRVVLILGWIHFMKNAVVVVATLVSLVGYSGRVDETNYFPGCCSLGCYAFLGFLYVFIGLWICVAASVSLRKVGVLKHTIFVTRLAKQVRDMFLACSFCGMLLNVILYAVCGFARAGHKDAGKCSSLTESGCCCQAAHELYGHVEPLMCLHNFLNWWEVLGEAFAQSVAQSVMWTSGGALAPTGVFVMSCFTSVLALTYGGMGWIFWLARSRVEGERDDRDSGGTEVAYDGGHEGGAGGRGGGIRCHGSQNAQRRRLAGRQGATGDRQQYPPIVTCNPVYDCPEVQDCEAGTYRYPMQSAAPQAAPARPGGVVGQPRATTGVEDIVLQFPAGNGGWPYMSPAAGQGARQQGRGMGAAARPAPTRHTSQPGHNTTYYVPAPQTPPRGGTSGIPQTPSGRYSSPGV